MKKLLLGLALASTLVSAQAQVHREMEFLLVNTLEITNKFGGFTNLLSSQLNPGATNAALLAWTNNFGAYVQATNSDTTQVIRDVPLWSDRNGSPPMVVSGSNSVFSGAISAATLNIHLLTAGSGANAAVNFTFIGLADGVHESTTAGDQWTVGVTSAGATPVDIVTNVPLWKWPGASKLRLLTIVNSDTDATSQAWFDTITLNGFVP